MTTVCEGCEVSVCDIGLLCADINKLYTYLAEHNFVKLNIKCAYCESVLNVNISLRNFRCDMQQRVTKNKRSKIERCQFYVSALKGTFFERSHLKLSEICQLTYFFCVNTLSISFICENLTISNNTVIDWNNFCREICIAYCETNFKKLRGPGKTVEVDKAKFGKRKCNKGCVIDGTSVFSGLEGESKDIFFVAIKDRTKETLTALIKEYIEPGTTTVSDCWNLERLQRIGKRRLFPPNSKSFT